jgi:anaphase-promoting complex subunit 5
MDDAYTLEIAEITRSLALKQEAQLEDDDENSDLDITDESECNKLIRFPEAQKWSRQQSELYIAKQVELLQCSEAAADSPEAIDTIAQRIIETNPDLAQVHYLTYLNSLRLNEFCDAVKSLYWCFDRGCQSEDFYHPDSSGLNDDLKMTEEIDRGFRYAALNLAALHARFGHKDEAILALNEAIMMAQEANDHLCLQHALTWLFRVQPQNRKLLMQRCISKCNSLGLSYLTSLGIQSLSQLVSLNQHSGGSPAQVMDILSKSDLLNCQHSMIELILTSYAQKSAFWTMYGRSHLSCITSQLLLNLDTSEPSR